MPKNTGAGRIDPKHKKKTQKREKHEKKKREVYIGENGVETKTPKKSQNPPHRSWGRGFAELIFFEVCRFLFLKNLGANASMPFGPKMSR